MLYRSDWESGGGTWAGYGLPLDTEFVDAKIPLEARTCQGDDPDGSHYNYNLPSPGYPYTEYLEKYVRRFGERSVLIFDPNHQNSYPRSFSWETWAVFGVQIDGQVVRRSALGFPKHLTWWHDYPE